MVRRSLDRLVQSNRELESELDQASIPLAIGTGRDEGTWIISLSRRKVLEVGNMAF